MGYEVLIEVNSSLDTEKGYEILTKKYVFVPGKYDMDEIKECIQLYESCEWHGWTYIDKLTHAETLLAQNILEIINTFLPEIEIGDLTVEVYII